jgi:hypothetical protein
MVSENGPKMAKMVSLHFSQSKAVKKMKGHHFPRVRVAIGI